MYALLNNSMKKAAAVYLCASVFCLVFFLVYSRFSHGVYSSYMTWLFMFPFVLGFLPCVMFCIFDGIPKPKRLCLNLYSSGIAAVTVSSLLRGIFDIAGTSSQYQQYLMYAGCIMIICGIGVYFAQHCFAD